MNVHIDSFHRILELEDECFAQKKDPLR